MREPSIHQPYDAETSDWYRCCVCSEKQPNGAIVVWVPEKDYVGYSFSGWCSDCAKSANIKFEVRGVAS